MKFVFACGLFTGITAIIDSKVIAHFPQRYLSEISPQLSFFLLLSIPLSNFSWFPQ